jgi:predicted DNA-binding transcriptional regulator YafY
MVIPRPTTRLLALLEVLQSRDIVSGTELARRLEIDGRSVRRYIAMLAEIGILVETVRGPHGGYRLRPGPRIPPLLLTEEEAVALALALGTLPHLGLALAPETLTGLRAKLERTLSERLRGRVRALAASIALPPGPVMVPADGALLNALGEAASAGRRLRMRYSTPEGADTDRLVDPYGVARWSRAWYLVAYCHLRKDVRLFRLDRIAAVEVTGVCFTPPADFDAYAHVARAMAAYPGRWVVDVRLALPLAAAQDSIIAPYGTLTADGAGSRFQGRFDNLDGLARDLVALRCRFVVAEPPELRAALRRLAVEIAGLATES